MGILPIGHMDETYAKGVAAALLGELNIRGIVLKSLEHPAYAFNTRRIQYNAGMIIKQLESMKFPGINKVIALIDADLFIPVFSHVMGEARVGGRCALVSVFRLMESMERTVKVALHELGHLLSLGHCSKAECLMSFSKSIEQLDTRSSYFCDYCRSQIEYRIMHGN